MSNKMFKVLKIMIVVVMCVVLIVPCCITTYAADSLPSYDLQYLPSVSGSDSAKTDVYVVGLSDGTKSGRESEYYYMRACCDSEIVAYYYNYGTECRLKFISSGEFVISENRYTIYANGNTNIYKLIDNQRSGHINNNDYYECMAGIERASSTDKWETNGSLAANTYVFKDYDSAVNYLETGIINNCVKEPDKSYDGEGVYLDNFQMIVHDSNDYSAYYIEFKYSIPDSLKSSSTLVLYLKELYHYGLTAGLGLYSDSWEFEGLDSIDLLANPTGYKLYLDNIEAIRKRNETDIDTWSGYNNMVKRQVLGTEMGIDTNTISIGGFGGNTIASITTSRLYLNCDVVANGVYGVEYTGQVDFLSGANNMSSYTPSSTGDYQYNSDFISQGHYYTEVGTDAAGNATYNYYYINAKGDKQETDAAGSGVDVSTGNVTQINNNSVNIPDTINVNLNGSLSGGSSSTPNFDNVTIEDDDLTFKSLADVMKSGFGIIDDVDTDVKGDGFPSMLAYLYQGLPDVFNKIIMLGVSSVTGIAILLRLFNR